MIKHPYYPHPLHPRKRRKFVLVHWAKNEPIPYQPRVSRAIPSQYVLQFRELGGGEILAESNPNGPNPQLVELPSHVTEVNVVLMIGEAQTYPTGHFQVTDNLNGQILADFDVSSNFSTDRLLAHTYIISTTDADN